VTTGRRTESGQQRRLGVSRRATVSSDGDDSSDGLAVAGHVDTGTIPNPPQNLRELPIGVSGRYLPWLYREARMSPNFRSVGDSRWL
jgi:hypothetical protein